MPQITIEEAESLNQILASAMLRKCQQRPTAGTLLTVYSERAMSAIERIADVIDREANELANALKDAERKAQ